MRRGARWSKAEDDFLMNYLGKVKEEARITGFDFSMIQLGREISRKLERSPEAIVNRIYKLRREG